MKKVAKDEPREAIGCFVMLILGAIMTLGCMVIILPNVILKLSGKEVEGFWRSLLVWVALPLVGIVLMAWFTYGRPGRAGGHRRGG
jgi:hypothetical protein